MYFKNNSLLNRKPVKISQSLGDVISFFETGYNSSRRIFNGLQLNYVLFLGTKRRELQKSNFELTKLLIRISMVLLVMNKMSGNKERYICTFYKMPCWSVGQLQTKIARSKKSILVQPLVYLKGPCGSNLYILYPDETLNTTLQISTGFLVLQSSFWQTTTHQVIFQFAYFNSRIYQLISRRMESMLI